MAVKNKEAPKQKREFFQIQDNNSFVKKRLEAIAVKEGSKDKKPTRTEVLKTLIVEACKEKGITEKDIEKVKL